MKSFTMKVNISERMAAKLITAGRLTNKTHDQLVLESIDFYLDSVMHKRRYPKKNKLDLVM